jgi:hypothetical protein
MLGHLQHIRNLSLKIPIPKNCYMSVDKKSYFLVLTASQCKGKIKILTHSGKICDMTFVYFEWFHYEKV